MKDISEQEILTRLAFDNPWWGVIASIDRQYRAWPKRDYLAPFYKLVTDLTVRRAVVLMGPRRVGKTVMVFHTIQMLLKSGVPAKNILYISLETPIYFGLSLERIIRLFQHHHAHERGAKLYVFFDEIQYHKKWEVHLKSVVDSFKSIRTVATGSAAAALKIKSRESGAGRFTEFMLPPLTFAEYLRFIRREKKLFQNKKTYDGGYNCENIEELNNEFVNYLNYGGYPEAVMIKAVRENSMRYIKSDIIDKVLLRDLPSLYGIDDIQELNRLFTTLAYNTGNEVSIEALSNSSGIAKNTVKKYIEYLEAAFLIIRISRIDQNARRFKREMAFKVYLTNPSMRAALFEPISTDHKDMGHLTETAIFSQWFHSAGMTKHLHYARWKEGEIDMVSKDGEWIMEVKWSNTLFDDPRKLKSLLFFVKHNPGYTDVAVTTKSIRGIKEIDGTRIDYYPSAEYCYTVGKNLLKHIRPRN